MPSQRVDPKPSETANKTTLFIISGEKLVAPSAPLELCVYEYLEEQFGEASETPAVFEELGWIDKRGCVVGDRAPSDLQMVKFDPAYVRPLKLLDQLGPRAIQLGLWRAIFWVIYSIMLPTVGPPNSCRRHCQKRVTTWRFVLIYSRGQSIRF